VPPGHVPIYFCVRRLFELIWILYVYNCRGDSAMRGMHYLLTVSPILIVLATGPMVAISNYYQPDGSAMKMMATVLSPCEYLVKYSSAYKEYLIWWASIGPQYCACGHRMDGPHP